ncbi:type 4 pilus major pilin [Rugamonas sp. DEMB1]|uniref:type 4 pilus major pilin n=1 Tax=Rugamonas sp. DEMB1 TaxID=3039386 RepID=UPI00244D24FE|nr:type 4 pilus major pilin [Rugamonas sp. DEMB1]WGG49427.1 type 4 pilus major pilin [Rugamonas sp. DEMB1]
MNQASLNKSGIVAFRSRQRGASLLEGIAYLGIAAIVILGAVSLLGSAFGNARSNQASEEVVSLRTAVKKLYSGQTYPATIVSTLIAARAVPGSLVVDTDKKTVTNSWGGAVTVTAGPNGGSFVIGYPAVPQDVCINLVTGANGWTRIDNDGKTPITVFPVNAEAALGVCNDAAGNKLAFAAN